MRLDSRRTKAAGAVLPRVTCGYCYVRWCTQGTNMGSFFVNGSYK